MLFSTVKYNFFQSRNPGIWALPIPGFGIPGLQSLHATNQSVTEAGLTKLSMNRVKPVNKAKFDVIKCECQISTHDPAVVFYHI